MENNKTALALGFFGGTYDDSRGEEEMKEYEHRKANADKIEAALMTACMVVTERLEQGAKEMDDAELYRAIGTLAEIATTIGALNLYAAKPYMSGFCHA